MRNIKRFEGYVNTVSHLHQRGFDFFEKEYVDRSLMSKEHRRILEDDGYRDNIMCELGVHPKHSKPGQQTTAFESALDQSVDESKDTSSSDEEPPAQMLLSIEEENLT